IDFTTDDRTQNLRYRNLIAKHLGDRRITQSIQIELTREVNEMVKKGTNPKLIFLHLKTYLEDYKIEVPSYYMLAELITTAISRIEKELQTIVDQHITLEQKWLLDRLLE